MRKPYRFHKTLQWLVLLLRNFWASWAQFFIEWHCLHMLAFSQKQEGRSGQMNVLQLLYIYTPWGLSMVELGCTVSILATVLQKITIIAEWATVHSYTFLKTTLAGPRRSLNGFPIQRLTLLKCNQCCLCCKPCHKAGEALQVAGGKKTASATIFKVP